MNLRPGESSTPDETSTAVLPILAAALVLMCIPTKAVLFFMVHYGNIEILILGGGVCLFSVQMILCWKALRWLARACLWQTRDFSIRRWSECWA
jgi:protein-S-isoprenylcysteine O-methyltransferase Ste14